MEHEQGPLVGAAWERGGLVVPASFTQKTQRAYLSPSTAAAMVSCPARWLIEKLIESAPNPFDAREIGTSVHAALEILFRLPPPERTPESLEGIIADLEVRRPRLSIPLLKSDLARWRHEIRAKAVGLFNIENPSEVEVEGVELEVRAKVAGVPFFGIIDRLDRRDGAPVIVDYKTGEKVKEPDTRYDGYGAQLRLYAAALEDAFGEAPSRAQLYYVGASVAFDVDLSKRRANAVKKSFAAGWELFSEAHATGHFACKASGLCGYCPAVTVCPVGSRSRWNKPKISFGVSGDALGIEPLRPTKTKARTEKKEAPKMKTEGKPWEAWSDEGELNPNSYAATAAFGLASLVVDEMYAHHQTITQAKVEELLGVFAQIVGRVERQLGFRPNLQAGLNTRLRGALRSALNTMPIPFGQPEASWRKWQGALERRTFAIAKAAFALADRYSDIDLEGEPEIGHLAEPDSNVTPIRRRRM